MTKRSLFPLAAGAIALSAGYASSFAAVDPGAVGGLGKAANLQFTLMENGNENFSKTYMLPGNGFFESGTLVICEQMAVCDPTDPTFKNFSDEIQWAGGDTITFLSDPTAFVDPNFGNGFRVATEVGTDDNNSVKYVATNPDGGTTTYIIVSDPEPASLAILAFGLAGIGLLRRGARGQT